MTTWDLLYGGENSDDDWFNTNNNDEENMVATTHHNHRSTTLPPPPQPPQQPPPPAQQKPQSKKGHLLTYVKPHCNSLKKDIDVIDLTQSPPLRPVPSSHHTITNPSSITPKCHNSTLWRDDPVNICNPYQKRVTPTTATTTTTKPKPFIGGAEMARKKARHDLFDHWNATPKPPKKIAMNKSSRPPTRIVRPGEDFISLPRHHHHHHNNHHGDPPPVVVIPTYRNSMERFYHAVLHWPWSDYVAATGTSAHTEVTTLWEQMCVCLRLDPSTCRGPIQSTYPDLVTHCQARTMVLLEEVRNTLCEGVAKILPHLHNSGRNSGGNSSSHSHHPKHQWIQLDVQVVAMELCDKSSSSSSHNHKQHRPTTTTTLEPNFRIMVQSSRSFTKPELYHIRPGAVFVIRPRSSAPPTSSRTGPSTAAAATRPIFGVVVTGNRDMVEKSHKFEFMIFNEFERFSPSHEMVTVTYVTQLVTEFRCYEALNTNYHIHFEAQLLGNPEPPVVPVPSSTHTRFIDSDDDSTNHPHEDRNSYLVKVTPKKKNGDIHQDSDDDSTNHPGEDRLSYLVKVTPPVPTNDDDDDPPPEHENSTYFVVPPLNPTQNRVATQFLQSPSGKITLVQGPPGTGKTTLLVSILCRYLIQSLSSSTTTVLPVLDDKDKPGPMDPSGPNKCQGRIMVCAPTNKAVHVLASRFVKATQKSSDVSFNIILVGDADKILMDDRSSGGGGHRSSSSSSSTKSQPPNQGSAHRYHNKAAPTATPLSADQLALRSIFLYTWIPSIVEGYVRILSYFSPRYTGSDTPATLWQLSKQLQQRLTSSLTHLPSDFVQRMNKIVSSLQFISSSSTNNPRMLQDNSIRKDVESHIAALKKLPTDVVWEQVRD